MKRVEEGKKNNNSENTETRERNEGKAIKEKISQTDNRSKRRESNSDRRRRERNRRKNRDGERKTVSGLIRAGGQEVRL